MENETVIIQVTSRALDSMLRAGFRPGEQRSKLLSQVFSLLQELRDFLDRGCWLAINMPPNVDFEEFKRVELVFTPGQEWSHDIRSTLGSGDYTKLLGLVERYNCLSLNELFDGGLELYLAFRHAWNSGHEALVIDDEAETIHLIVPMPPTSWEFG